MKQLLLFILILCCITVQAQVSILFYLRREMSQSNVKTSDARVLKGPGAINQSVGLETIISLAKSKKGNFIALNPSVS